MRIDVGAGSATGCLHPCLYGSIVVAECAVRESLCGLTKSID
jgi:hypothetical protein